MFVVSCKFWDEGCSSKTKKSKTKTFRGLPDLDPPHKTVGRIIDRVPWSHTFFRLNTIAEWLHQHLTTQTLISQRVCFQSLSFCLWMLTCPLLWFRGTIIVQQRHLRTKIQETFNMSKIWCFISTNLAELLLKCEDTFYIFLESSNI